MAGRPKRKAMVELLIKRTQAECEDPEATVLDYVEQWVRSGGTLNKLVRELSEEAPYDFTRDNLTSYLHKTFDDAKARIATARRIGAHGLAEEAIDLADEPVEDKMAAARTRNRMQARQWLAERWNRDELGGNKQGVNVEVNIAALHLDALRARKVQVVEQPAQDAELVEGEAVDVELLPAGPRSEGPEPLARARGNHSAVSD